MKADGPCKLLAALAEALNEELLFPCDADLFERVDSIVNPLDHLSLLKLLGLSEPRCSFAHEEIKREAHEKKNSDDPRRFLWIQIKEGDADRHCGEGLDRHSQRWYEHIRKHEPHIVVDTP